MEQIKQIDVQRFNAFVAYSRRPEASHISQELAWYSNESETVLGVLLLDLIDNDFAVVILKRDEGQRFRAIDTSASFESLEVASQWLANSLRWHSSFGGSICEQGDCSGKSIKLFTSVIPIERQNPYFVRLNTEIALAPAKRMITEIMPHYKDIDGNFVEQFQTSGFDSRLWELYLYCYFNEEGFLLDREHSSPDFLLNKLGAKVAVEAVIVARKENNPPVYFKSFPTPKPISDIIEAHRDEMPLKFSSALCSKLTKKYWSLPHVQANPLIFAIADFHDDMSMQWSSTALINYLYGVRQKFHYDGKHQLIIDTIQIKFHKKQNGIEIPSGFFYQPDAENVSAIISSASGTISKFNRLGKQAGFGDKRVTMIREGTCYDHDPKIV